MFINDIAVSAGIQIVVGIGLQTLEFDTSVAEVHENCIYVEPILKDDKMVGFSTKGLVLSIIVTDVDEGWQFLNVKIRNIKSQDGKLFHEISCKTEARGINRCGACRIWLGEPGAVMAGMGTRPFDVTVKDISITGISSICSIDEDLPIGSVVNISFRDKEIKIKFDLSAIIVRNHDMERARILYGCKLNQESPALVKYLNEKQREKLKTARQLRTMTLNEKKA